MNSTAPHMNSASKITLTVILKLVVVLAVIVGIGVLTEQIYGTALCQGAALGMFLAEHFASTRSREFLCLICLPAVLGCTAIIVLSLRGSTDFAAAELGVWMPLILLLGVVPAAISVVALSILSSLIFKVTGVRLLKFEWNSATEPVVEN